MITARIEGISWVKETIAGPALGNKKIFLWKGRGEGQRRKDISNSNLERKKEYKL
jgi:hypothetical protein